jgi:hypothetical protein
MTRTNIAAYARILTNTDSTTFSDADALTLLNMAYGQRVLDILKVSVDKNASIQEAYADIVSAEGLDPGDNGYNGEYAFPTNLLKPVRAEIKLKDKFVKAVIYDINENDLSEIDDLDSFSEDEPYVRFERNSYYIRPLPTEDVSDGFYIWYEKRQESLTALSETPDFEQNLHDILAYDIAEIESIRHPELYTTEWRNAFFAKKRDIEARFFNFYKTRFKRTFKLIPKPTNYK